MQIYCYYELNKVFPKSKKKKVIIDEWEKLDTIASNAFL